MEERSHGWKIQDKISIKNNGNNIMLENPHQCIDLQLVILHKPSAWEIIGLPVNSNPFEPDSAVPVLLFRQPDNVLNATEWPYEIINQDYFHLLHEATVFKGDQLDNLLIASREGITWVYFNQDLETSG